jgi:hypothetical protein
LITDQNGQRSNFQKLEQIDASLGYAPEGRDEMGWEFLVEFYQRSQSLCDIKVNGWTINDFRIVQNGQKMSVLGPQVLAQSRNERFATRIDGPSNDKQEVKEILAYGEGTGMRHGKSV